MNDRDYIAGLFRGEVRPAVEAAAQSASQAMSAAQDAANAAMEAKAEVKALHVTLFGGPGIDGVMTRISNQEARCNERHGAERTAERQALDALQAARILQERRESSSRSLRPSSSAQAQVHIARSKAIGIVVSAIITGIGGGIGLWQLVKSWDTQAAQAATPTMQGHRR